MNSPWLQRLSPRPGTIRLFCFPHAGGAAGVYRLWPGGLPGQIEVIAAQLPGRANRLYEPPASGIPQIVDELVRAIRPLATQPFAFFGHSMGSLIAVQVARALADTGGPMPAHLVVSGRPAPHLPDIATPLAHLSDREFVAEIDRRYGGIPTEILDDADVLALLLPSLRADLAALESFRPVTAAPLPCPVTVFGGSEDRLTPREHLDAWRSVTSRSFRVRVFPGGHFYLDRQRADVLADISATLAPILRAATTYSESTL
jgi:medium-chain acyl-[acyl-carrier-protein] hydrolase